MQTILIGLIALVAILMAVTAVRVVVRDRASAGSLLLTMAMFGTCLWLVSLIAILLGPSGRVETWTIAATYPLLLVGPAIYHFSAVTVRMSGWRRHLLIIVWPASLMLGMTLIASGSVVKGVAQYAWGFFPLLDVWALSAVGWTAALTLIGTDRLIRAARSSIPERGARIGMLGKGILAGCFGLIDLLPGFGVPLPPIGFLGYATLSLIIIRILGRYNLITEVKPAFAAPQILATMQGAVIATDLDGTIVMSNRAAEKLLLYDKTQLLGRDISTIVATPFNIGTASDTLMKGMTIRDRAMLWRTSDDALIEVGVSASLLRDADGIPTGIVYVATDISAKERAKQIEYQAFHDALTGLPNRTLLRKLLENAIEDHQIMGGGAPAVLFLDLDGFKLVNDSLGHSAGDKLLQAVSSRLREALRDTDILGRLGGDEFLFIIRVSAESDAIAVGEKILNAVQERVSVHGEEIGITGSVGIAIYPRHGSDSESLMKNADTAMYAAKESGKNQISVCGPEMGERASRRFQLESVLRTAVESESLELHYQPIVRLADGVVVGAEALVRLRHEDSLMNPEEFLPIAEEIGLISEIGEWVMFCACREAARWSRELDQMIQLSVNLSVDQLSGPGIEAAVESALQLNDVSPGRLILEITESAAMRNVDTSIRVLGSIREMGVQIAVDDFGTGYSSLGYLQQLPIDFLKIDRSFARGIGKSQSSTAIVSATLALAHALGLEVIAEGVETVEQIEFLSREKCAKAQGFAFSAPMSETSFRSWLDSFEGPPRLVAQSVGAS